jgi:hypothetical protein
MRHIRLPWVVVTALGLLACGGSAKSTPSTATAPATESTAAAPSSESKNVSTKSESPKTKAEEESAAESSAPECEKDKDCTIFADCCTCKAIPAAAKLPQPCEAVCGESKCEVKGKTIDNVACVSGRCKVK